jgi:hypothetical protein
MDARDRFLIALGEAVSNAYYSQGVLFMSVHEIQAIADEQHVPEAVARATLDLLDEHGLLERQDGGRDYGDGIGLLLRYEEAERRLFRERNVLRREILRLAAAAYDEGTRDLVYQDDGDHFVDVPWAEAYAASLTLEYLGYLKVQAFMGHNFEIEITPTGRELQRDATELARGLPVNAADDEHATADVAPDALRELILDVEDVMEQRGWSGTSRELARGDDQYGEGHWTDAVREYYSALESALKHRLDEAGEAYSDKAALRALAKIAADKDIIAPNYQALFGFADSIRSPRSHGAGANVVEVEVGKAEALLMGNHVRALILYLGQRP